jgi:hypothetical protein
MPLISEVMVNLFSESRIILLRALNKAFCVFIDLLCLRALRAMTQNIRESLQITLHPPVRKPFSHYHTSYRCADSSAVYKKWGEQPSKPFS